MTFIERAVDFEPLPEEERAAKQGDGKTLEGYAGKTTGPASISLTSLMVRWRGPRLWFLV